MVHRQLDIEGVNTEKDLTYLIVTAKFYRGNMLGLEADEGEDISDIKEGPELHQC